MVAMVAIVGGFGAGEVAGQNSEPRWVGPESGLVEARAAARLAGRDGALAPAPWLQEDPGARSYQRARDLLSRGRYGEAARAFAELREEHPQSAYVPDSFYWEAFARSRDGGPAQLRTAVELLTVQAERHPDAATVEDADALRVRIEGELARRGDARAAAVIAQEAQVPCGPGHETRLAALSALMNMNEDQALPILQDVLRQRDACSAELRARAVFLIAQKLNGESVDILLDLAHRNPDPDPEVRGQAVFWLHQVRTPEALAALESILAESDDPELQEHALFGIAQRTGDARAMEALRGYASRSDVSDELRGNAIFWIGQNTSAGGERYLIELYPTLDDPELKENALFAIAQSGSETGHAWLLERARDPSEDMDVRMNALFWAGQSGTLSESEIDLRSLFDSFEDSEMRGQVIFVAAQRGSESDIDFLMDVARNAEDPELRQNAIFWLGQSDDPRVPEFLMSLLRG
jgi:HEAT repeat protein